MAKYLIEGPDGNTATVTQSMGPEDYAKQLAAHGYKIIQVDGQDYNQSPREPGRYVTLTNPKTGLQRMVRLDGTPETSERINRLIEQGFSQSGTSEIDPSSDIDLDERPGSRGGVDFGGGTYETPTIGDVTIDPTTLPPNERVQARFGQDFDQWYSNVIDAQAGNLERYYDFPTPRMDAAQMDIYGEGGIPQPGAQTPQQFEALQFLLSGQGFDPATMARMRSGVTDAAAMAGRSGAGTARLMGQQAGLAGSPAAMALEASARRQQAGATTRGLNQVEIQNAMQGMQNRVTGAGMELNRQTSGAAMANQMALSNASNILSGMQQNVANTQQTNLTNTGNLMGQRMTQAGQQAGLYGQGAQAYNQAALGLAGQAPFFNAANQNAWAERQAEFERERALANAGLQRQGDLANAGFGFDRYTGDRDWLGRMALGPSGYDFYGAGGDLSRTRTPGSAWGNLNFLNPGAGGGN
jgi:hypothetical protein